MRGKWTRGNPIPYRDRDDRVSVTPDTSRPVAGREPGLAPAVARCHTQAVGAWRAALVLVMVAGAATIAVPAVAADTRPPPSPVGLDEVTMTPADAPSRAGARVVDLLRDLRAEVRETRYQARTEIRRGDGFYAWDCSGMAAWLLRRTAPQALRAVGAGRPVARDFFHAIARAPTARPRRGWQRLGHVAEVRPGDVFAWLRSPASTSKVTGHVGFVVGQPREVPAWPGAYAVRIADATGLPHQDDTRAMDGPGGFGFGTMVFVTDDQGEVVAYGWFGTVSGGFMPARVLFGRPSR